MHSITNYIHNSMERASLEDFCGTYSLNLLSPSNLVATIGNVRIIMAHNNKNVKILIKYSKLQISLSLNIDRLFSPEKYLQYCSYSYSSIVPIHILMMMG
ncbi:MAG: hypothetical protein QXR34_03835 [Saccharolobus sp.]